MSVTADLTLTHAKGNTVKSFSPNMLVKLDDEPIYRYRVDRKAAAALLAPEINRSNRPLTEGYKNHLESDMQTGRWFKGTHDPVKLAPVQVDGEWQLALINGQHRIKAFLDSGLPYIDLYFVFDADLDEYRTTDIGRKRRVADMLVDVEHHRLTYAAIGRAMYWGAVTPQAFRADYIDPRTPTEERLREFITEHLDAVSFAVGLMPGSSARGLSKAGVFAVFGRAYYTVDHACLRIFAEAYRTGLYADEEYCSASLLGRMVQRKSSPQSEPWTVTLAYRYAAPAIRAACVDHSPLKRLMRLPQGREPFSIPNDPMAVDAS